MNYGVTETRVELLLHSCIHKYDLRIDRYIDTHYKKDASIRNMEAYMRLYAKLRIF